MSEASGHFKAKNMMPFYVALFMMLFSTVLIRFVHPSTRLCTTTSARQSTRRSTRTPARHSSPPSTKRNARPSKNFKGFLLKRIQPKPYFSGTTPSLRRSVRQPTRRRTRKFAKLSTTPSSTQSVRPSTRPWPRRNASWSELSQIFNLKVLNETMTRYEDVCKTEYETAYDTVIEQKCETQYETEYTTEFDTACETVYETKCEVRSQTNLSEPAKYNFIGPPSPLSRLCPQIYHS